MKTPFLIEGCDPRVITAAREFLGRQLGIGRPVSCLELADALELTGPPERRREFIVQMEHARRDISGPIRVAINAMCAGYRPRALRDIASLHMARAL
jgi:hypothetical protein